MSTVRLSWVWAGTALAVVGLVSAAGAPATYSGYSDVATSRSSAAAGIWAPDPPTACGPLSSYAEVVWGTSGDDVFVGDDVPRVYLGLEGRDRLESTAAADCLVGGPGRDRLVGHDLTVVVPGAGDRVVVSGTPAPEAVDDVTPAPEVVLDAPEAAPEEQHEERLPVPPDDRAAGSRPAPTAPTAPAPSPTPATPATPADRPAAPPTTAPAPELDAAIDDVPLPQGETGAD